MKRSGIFAALVLIAAAPAHAIPVTFDLAGTLRETVDWDLVTNTQTYDLSRQGTAFSLQFSVDSELFGPPTESITETARRRLFTSLTPEALLADMEVGGEPWDTNPYGSRNLANIGVGDSLGLVCNPTCRFAPDQFSFSMLSEQVGASGVEQRRLLGAGFVASSGPLSENPGDDWFDFDDVATLEQVLLLPLLNLNPISLTVQDYRFDCAAQCFATGIVRTSFEVTSVTRSVAAVPEPGTLALLGAGLGLSFALRRRRPAFSN
jgi:PEP-CTERM motif